VVNTDDVKIEMKIEDTGGADAAPAMPGSSASAASASESGLPTPDAGDDLDPTKAVQDALGKAASAP
jgi:hypothetical protein